MPAGQGVSYGLPYHTAREATRAVVALGGEAGVAARLLPSVVTVRVASSGGSSLGSGFVVSADGYVITNEHVVSDADEVQVRLVDERQFQAVVVGRDPKLDLALLKLKDAKDLPAVQLGSSSSLRIGY